MSAQFKVRLDEELHELLRAASEADGRSINAEILRRLRDSFERPPLAEEIATRVAEKLAASKGV